MKRLRIGQQITIDDTLPKRSLFIWYPDYAWPVDYCHITKRFSAEYTGAVWRGLCGIRIKAKNGSEQYLTIRREWIVTKLDKDAISRLLINMYGAR